MSFRGIELDSDTTVSQAAIRDQGFAFVVGSLGTGSATHLTAARANDYLAAGLTIVSVYEDPGQASDGAPIGYDPRLFENPQGVLQDVAYHDGVADGRSAYALARTVGQAMGSAIYFEVDADVSAGISYVLDYFRGIAAGFDQASLGSPGYKVGVYGSGYVLDAVYDADLADYKWLAAPTDWQGSAGYATYDIQQYATGDTTTFPGVVIAHDKTSDAKAGGDFGQWSSSTSTPNLVVNDLSVRATPLLPGGTATIGFAIGNVGTAIARATRATLYLSDDATITAADTVLGTFDIPSLAANAAATDSLVWNIPGDIAAGTYHVGIAAEAVAGETSTTDNAYATSFTIAATPASSPNLVINHLSLGSAAVTAGGVQTISFEIGNAGTAAAAASSATLYLSTDATITASDVFLGAFPIPSLAAKGAVAKSLSATIPAGTPVGTYFIGVLTGPVAGEANTNDNAFATSFTVTVEPVARPNLVINYLTLGAPSVGIGGAQTVDFAVGNAGSTMSEATSAIVYLSRDAIITSADTALGSFALPSLAAGAAEAFRLAATIPTTTAEGTWYIGVLAGPVADEPNINDNSYAEAFSVIRTPGSVSISDVTVSEGNSGTTLATFIVTRTGGTQAFEVGFATSDGGATLADGDYVATSGTLAFAENEVTRTITVAINGDLVDEARAEQTFFVELSGASDGAVIADSTGQGTIADDDRQNRLPVVTGRDVRVHAGQAISGAALVSSVSDADGDTITQYAFRDASDGGGFLRADGVAVAAGSWATVAGAELASIAYVGAAGEGSEPIDLRVFDGKDWSDVVQLAATTIADLADDYGSTPTSAGSVSPGGAITGSIETAGDADWFAIELTAGQIYRFDLEGSDTAAGTLADPVLELRDSDGSSRELAVDDDNGSGRNARLTYTAARSGTHFLSARSGDASGGTYTLSATVLPSTQLAIAAVEASRLEGRSGTTRFSFTVTRSGDLSADSSANWAVTGAGMSPASGSDFAGGAFPSGTVSFAAGEARQVITVDVLAGGSGEPIQQFVVTLSNPVGATLATGSAIGSLQNGDADWLETIILSAADFSSRIGELDAKAEAGNVAAIYLTDDNVPVVSLTADQLVAGREAMHFITRKFVVDAQASGMRGHYAAIAAADLGGTTNIAGATFADGRLVFNSSDPAAQVVRLYQAALGRLPDQGGLNDWIVALGQGVPLLRVAEGFIVSPEFQERFGSNLSEAAFVTRLYANVLNRVPDPGGFDYWMDQLARGTSRAQVLVDFSESAENKANTTALLRAGVWDLDDNAGPVARLYDTVFGRIPDAEGARHWDRMLDSGAMTLQQVAEAFVASDEFRSVYAGLGTQDFVSALYENTLHRGADLPGLTYWVAQLDSGAQTRAAVVLGFSESAEHRANTAENIMSEDPSRYGVLIG